jgi:hypothetical protein
VAGPGYDGAIYYRFWAGTNWTNWTPVPSATIATPAVVAFAPNELELLAIGPDHHLYYNDYINSAFQGWKDLGPYCLGVAASSSGNDNIDIFITGSDGAVYQKHWDDFSYLDWATLDGHTPFAPAAVSPEPNNIVMFVIGYDGQLWGRTYV